MAKPSRKGRRIGVDTYKAAGDLTAYEVGTLLKVVAHGGELRVTQVTAATDDPIGTLNVKVSGSAAGSDVSVQALNDSQEVLCIAAEALANGDAVGPAANGRVGKTVAVGSLYVGNVASAPKTNAAAGDLVLVNVNKSRRHA